MIFFFVAHTLSILLDLVWLAGRTDIDKDIEILLLRQQLRILQRTQSRSPRISRWEKLTLVLLVSKLTTLKHQCSRPAQSGRAPVQAGHPAEVAP